MLFPHDLALKWLHPTDSSRSERHAIDENRDLVAAGRQLACLSGSLPALVRATSRVFQVCTTRTPAAPPWLVRPYCTCSDEMMSYLTSEVQTAELGGTDRSWMTQELCYTCMFLREKETRKYSNPTKFIFF